MNSSKYWSIRSKLSYTQNALQQKQLKIGFLGGSITQQSAKHNYSDIMTMQLKQLFPEVMIQTQNLAIGATCSTLGCLLAKDVLDPDVDLVFVEYAVNDDGMDRTLRMQAREGIIQQIRKRLQADIFLIYTYKETMYDQYLQGNSGSIPESIADFEQLARHYQLNSCNVGLYAFDQMLAGLVRFEEWLPDNLHPTYRGSALYATCLMQAVGESLNSQLNPKAAVGTVSDHFGTLQTIPFEQLDLVGPWVVKATDEKWMRQFLYTTSVQSELTFEIEASCVMIGTLFGSTMSDLYVTINGSDKQWVPRVYEAWADEQNWYREDVLYTGERQRLTITLSCQKNSERVGTTTIIPHIYYR